MVYIEDLSREDLITRCQELEYQLNSKEINANNSYSGSILRNIFNSVTVGFVALDIDGKVIEFNKAYFDFTKAFYNSVPETGKHYDSYIPLDRLAAITNYFKQVFAGETVSFNDEFNINNRIYIILKTYVPLLNDAKEVTGILVSIQDITQKEEIQFKFARTYNTFYTVINSLQLMIFAVDSKSFDIIFANHYFVAVNGEAIGKNYFDFFQNDELKLKDVKKKLKNVPSQINLINMDEVFLPKFNRWMKVYFRQISWIEGEANIILFYLIDIEDYKQNQQQLKENNLKLESIISDRTSELQLLLNNLESEVQSRRHIETELMITKEQISLSLRKEKQLSNVKSRILNNVAHEINTPLTVISTAAFLIDIYLGKNKYSEIGGLLKQIQDSSTTLFTIIEHSQKASSIQTECAYTEYETLNFVDFVKDIIQQIENIDKSNHNFQQIFQSHVIILSTNYSILKQIILPIYDNAVKYSNAGTIIITKITEDLDFVQISIIDNGIGISDEDQEHIFDMFYRSQKHIGILPGSGLGLSIAKNQARSIGAKIYFNSKEGIGSEFTVEFPKVNLLEY